MASNQNQIIFEEPHSDDFALSLGGLALKWKETGRKNINVYNVFSRSNYKAKDAAGNKDFLEERILSVTATRIREEINCLNFLGANLITLGEKDAPLRGYELQTKKFEFVNAKRDKKDTLVLRKLIELYKKHLSLNCEVYTVLGIGGHTDHLLVRDAVIKAVLELKKKGMLKARVAFCEDIPYTEIFGIKSDKNALAFIKKYNLISITYPIDLEAKLKLLNFYKSQIYEEYFEDIRKGAVELQREANSRTPMERIWLYDF